MSYPSNKYAKYCIKSKKANKSYFKKGTYKEIYVWVINHLDLSFNWEVILCIQKVKTK